jgi:hypothetical protein
MLIQACERRLRDRPQAEAQPRVAAAPAAAPPAVGADTAGDTPVLTIDALLPRREDLADELETAGRGFRSIYGAVKSLLEDPAEAEEPDPSDATTVPPTAPPSGAGRPGGERG